MQMMRLTFREHLKGVGVANLKTGARSPDLAGLAAYALRGFRRVLPAQTSVPPQRGTNRTARCAPV